MSLRPRTALLAGLLLACLLGGCATASRPDTTTTTFVIVRHAEKADGGKDPSLAPAGQARAQALAARLQAQPLQAAYATGYTRTQETARPTAQAHGMTVTTYDAQLSAADFAAQLRRDHAAGTVLVVGHSNTAPELAAALCGCEVAPMADTEFDRLMTVRVERGGQADFHQERY